jgi:hypothetical protein
VFPFLMPLITDSFSSLKHVGLYVGYYRISAAVAHPLFRRAYSERFSKLALLSSLLALQIGWTCCGLASNSWLFLCGRSLSGVGSAGIITASRILIPAFALKLHGAQLNSNVCPVLLEIVDLTSPLLGSLYVVIQVSIGFTANIIQLCRHCGGKFELAAISLREHGTQPGSHIFCPPREWKEYTIRTASLERFVIYARDLQIGLYDDHVFVFRRLFWQFRFV